MKLIDKIAILLSFIIIMVVFAIFILTNTADATEVVVKPCHAWYEKSFHTRYDVSDSLIKFIEEFRGVEHVFHHNRYEIDVYIGKAFSWSEVEYEILSALSQRGFLGP